MQSTGSTRWKDTQGHIDSRQNTRCLGANDATTDYGGIDMMPPVVGSLKAKVLGHRARSINDCISGLVCRIIATRTSSDDLRVSDNLRIGKCAAA